MFQIHRADPRPLGIRGDAPNDTPLGTKIALAAPAASIPWIQKGEGEWRRGRSVQDWIGYHPGPLFLHSILFFLFESRKQEGVAVLQYTRCPTS